MPGDVASACAELFCDTVCEPIEEQIVVVTSIIRYNALSNLWDYLSESCYTGA